MLDATPPPKVIQIDYETNWRVSSEFDGNCLVSASGYGVHAGLKDRLDALGKESINNIFTDIEADKLIVSSNFGMVNPGRCRACDDL